MEKSNIFLVRSFLVIFVYSLHCQLPWKTLEQLLINHLNQSHSYINVKLLITNSISSHNYSSDFTTFDEKWIIESNRIWIWIFRWRDSHTTPNRIVKSAEFNRIELNRIASHPPHRHIATKIDVNFTTERIKRDSNSNELIFLSHCICSIETPQQSHRNRICHCSIQQR